MRFSLIRSRLDKYLFALLLSLPLLTGCDGSESAGNSKQFWATNSGKWTIKTNDGGIQMTWTLDASPSGISDLKLRAEFQGKTSHIKIPPTGGDGAGIEVKDTNAAVIKLGKSADGTMGALILWLENGKITGQWDWQESPGKWKSRKVVGSVRGTQKELITKVDSDSAIQVIQNAEKTFLRKAKDVSDLDYHLASAAVTLVNDGVHLSAGWGVVDEVIKEASAETLLAYRQYRSVVKANRAAMNQMFVQQRTKQIEATKERKKRAAIIDNAKNRFQQAVGKFDVAEAEKELEYIRGLPDSGDIYASLLRQLHDLRSFLKITQVAIEAVENEDFEQAERLIREARLLMPRHTKIRELEDQLRNQKKAAAERDLKLLDQIDAALASADIDAAKEQINKLQIKNPKHDGISSRMAKVQEIDLFTKTLAKATQKIEDNDPASANELVIEAVRKFYGYKGIAPLRERVASINAAIDKLVRDKYSLVANAISKQRTDEAETMLKELRPLRRRFSSADADLDVAIRVQKDYKKNLEMANDFKRKGLSAAAASYVATAQRSKREYEDRIRPYLKNEVRPSGSNDRSTESNDVSTPSNRSGTTVRVVFLQDEKRADLSPSHPIMVACDQVRLVRVGKERAYCGIAVGPMVGDDNKSKEYGDFRSTQFRLLEKAVAQSERTQLISNTRSITLHGTKFEFLHAKENRAKIVLLVGVQNERAVAYWFIGHNPVWPRFTKAIGARNFTEG